MIDVSATARRLQDAYTDGAIGPLTSQYPDLTLDEAYQVQLAQVDDWKKAGRRVVGQKVGLTSKAMQQALGVDEPDYGYLFADMEYPEGTPIDVSQFIAPRVEPEIGFILGSDLSGENVTADEALAAIKWVVPALEIVDSRIANWEIKLEDTIADNASSAGYVLGEARVAPSKLDLAAIHCVMTHKDQLAGVGDGKDVMGSPLEVLAWLANTLTRLGGQLRAGDVVLPGALCAMVPVTSGSVVEASFTGLGDVKATFA